jgi:hypothetical protein
MVFNPLELDEAATPAAVDRRIEAGDFAVAITMAAQVIGGGFGLGFDVVWFGLGLRAWSGVVGWLVGCGGGGVGRPASLTPTSTHPHHKHS